MAEQPPRKVRGKATCSFLSDLKDGEKLELEMDKGVPAGRNRKYLVALMGVLARDGNMFPLDTSSWTEMDNQKILDARREVEAIPREANAYTLGSSMYYFVIVAGAVLWQLSFIGGLGVILYTSSLFNGVFTATLLPLTEIAAVIAYHESFTGEKGMSLALCLLGFINYFYGEYRMMKDMGITEPMKHEQVIVTPHDDEQSSTIV